MKGRHQSNAPLNESLQEKLFPSRALWLALAAITATDITWLVTSERLSIDLASGRGAAQAIVLIAAPLLYCQTRPDPHLRRLCAPLSGAMFIVFSFMALRVINHLTMSVPFAYADDQLAKLDTLLGLDWLGYAEWVAARPPIIIAFQLAYVGLTMVALVFFIILFAAKRVDRAREFIRLIFWSGLTATIIGAFFPAQGAMVRYASTGLQTSFGPEAGIFYLRELYALRSNLPHVLNLEQLPGLVTMPSYHTTCGLLIVYCSRNVWLLQPLSILYATTMIASTPIMGGHYFVDLIGGGLLTACIVTVDSKSRRAVGSPPATATAKDGNILQGAG